MITISEVKSRISPRDFYQSEGLEIGKPNAGGWTFGGLCPFHDDKHKGNFRINVQTGAFKCFACNTSGSDIIDFLMARDNLDFKAAWAILKKRYRE